jgi:hypothetical protein
VHLRGQEASSFGIAFHPHFEEEKNGEKGEKGVKKKTVACALALLIHKKQTLERVYSSIQRHALGSLHQS